MVVLIYQGLKLKRTWVEINLDDLKYNFNQIRLMIDKKTKIMAIVKADAYGHGDKIVGKHFENCGADFLGVSNIEEALSLRRAGVKIPILILGYTPCNLVNILFQYSLTQTIFNFNYAKQLSEMAHHLNILISCHLKIDTGMNRIGFKARDDKDELEEILKVYKLSALEINGIFTHFSVADSNDEKDKVFQENQFERFLTICDKLTKSGINIGLRHCCNSAAIEKYPQMQLDMVRPGISLYGPYIDTNMKLKPAMTLKTKIIMVKQVNSGESIGYGRRFQTNSSKKIATICIGYADGLNRLLSNRKFILVDNNKLQILGSICMDQTMIDITEVKHLKEEDEIILFGKHGSNLKEIAKEIMTIPYELLCNINKRVPRLYIKDNKEFLFVDYNASI